MYDQIRNIYFIYKKSWTDLILSEANLRSKVSYLRSIFLRKKRSNSIYYNITNTHRPLSISSIWMAHLKLKTGSRPLSMNIHQHHLFAVFTIKFEIYAKICCNWNSTIYCSLVHIINNLSPLVFISNNLLPYWNCFANDAPTK